MGEGTEGKVFKKREGVLRKAFFARKGRILSQGGGRADSRSTAGGGKKRSVHSP